MARKAVEILKARGYTDEELSSMSAMLTPKFCSALEAEDVERERLAAETARLQTSLDDTTVWYNTKAVPALNKALADATTAKGEAARVQAQLKYQQEMGLARVAADQDGQDQNQNRNQNQNQNRDQNQNQNRNQNNEPDSRYVSSEVFLQTTDRFGEAIATATDIAEDHRELFGARIPGGVKGLRDEYQNAVKNNRFSGDLRQFWESKFNVQQKQTERAQATRQKEMDDYAAEKVQQARSEMANPMTRTLTQSRNPFVAKAATNGGTTTGKQPWEGGATVEQRRSDRVVRFAQKLVEKGA